MSWNDVFTVVGAVLMCVSVGFIMGILYARKYYD